MNDPYRKDKPPLKVLIDGRVETSDKVDPRFHHYIGMFRPPYDRRLEYAEGVAGTDFYYQDLLNQKWTLYLSGRYDIPQYVSAGTFASHLTPVATTTAQP